METEKSVTEKNVTDHFIGRKTFKRLCDECGTEYPAILKTSKYCSDKCYKAAKRKSKVDGVKPEKPVKMKVEKPEGKKSPEGSPFNLSPHMMIAIDLLKDDAKKWKELYGEEKEDRKKYQEALAKLEKEMMQKDHDQALQGLELKKPDLLDRLSNLPAPVLEAFGPLIGRLGNMLLPPEAGQPGAAPMEGVAGQLDEGQIQLLSWINALPELPQRNLLTILGKLYSMNEQQLVARLNQFLLSLNGHNGTATYNLDPSMYGG